MTRLPLAPLAAPAAAEDLPFELEAPDQPQELARLWGDRAAGPAGTLLRTPGGFVAPPRAHGADRRAVTISGVRSRWVPAEGATRGGPLPPGSDREQAADQPHADACLSQEPCAILLGNEEPCVTTLAE